MCSVCKYISIVCFMYNNRHCLSVSRCERKYAYQHRRSDKKENLCTVCPGISDPFISYYIKCVNTSWI